MPANSPLAPQQISQIAWSLVALANEGRAILNNPPSDITPNQSNVIAADVMNLSNIAANLFAIASQLIFTDSDSAFAVISAATNAANNKVAQISSTVGKINAVVNIFGAVVSLAVSLGSANFVSVLSAASNLATTVSSS